MSSPVNQTDSVITAIMPRPTEVGLVVVLRAGAGVKAIISQHRAGSDEVANSFVFSACERVLQVLFLLQITRCYLSWNV